MGEGPREADEIGEGDKGAQNLNHNINKSWG